MTISGGSERRNIKDPSLGSSFDWLIAAACLIIVPSAVLHSLLGADEKGVFAVVSTVLLGLGFVHKRSSLLSAPGLMLALLGIGVAASWVSDSYSQLLMSVVLIVSSILGFQLYRSLGKRRVLLVASWFTLAMLLGGLVAVVYSYLGYAPLLAVEVGYRTTHLYLTTFSFATVGSLIRPSGIFDEPGALVMFSAVVAMFNDVLQQNRRLNTAIVVLLIFTGSLAALALIGLYVFTSSAHRTMRKDALIFGGLVVSVFAIGQYAIPGNPLMTAVDAFYTGRLQIVDGGLAGDNRSNQVYDFFRLVNGEILARGANITHERFTEDLSSNPFSITFGYGLLISVPYFVLLAWLLAVAVKMRFRNSFTSLGLLILLLQRPYMYNMAWSILIAAVVWLLYSALRRTDGFAEIELRARPSPRQTSLTPPLAH